MIIVWSVEAVDDLTTLREYISQDDPAAAQRIALLVVTAVASLLSEYADVGRPGRVPGTRELVVAGTPFVVPYRVVGQTVQVLRVYHAARRWPDRF